jgi:hypothetical protein
MGRDDDKKGLPPVTVMDPIPGQKYVEYSKDGDDGERKSSFAPGLDIERKPKINPDWIFISRVEHPAPTHHLNVGDRLVALNGKKIEDYGTRVCSLLPSCLCACGWVYTMSVCVHVCVRVIIQHGVYI